MRRTSVVGGVGVVDLRGEREVQGEMSASEGT